MEINVLNRLNVPPYKAKYIGVFDENGNLVRKVSIDSIRKPYGNRLYRVGLLSDVHYNDTEPNIPNVQEGNDQFVEEDIDNAFSFFENKDSIDFCCTAGDITTDVHQHFQSWKNKVDDIAPNTPIYSCKGNHDNKASYGYEDEWLRCTMPENDGRDKIFFTGTDSSSYYFIEERDGVKDVYIFLNLNYSSNSNHATLKFDDGSYKYYDDNDIEELHRILDEHRNDRCFVFTHYFFPLKSGNPSNDYTRGGNKHSHDYWLTGRQFVVLNELNNYYTNSIWFSGHSHYQWKWQNTDFTRDNGEYHCDRANVCDYDAINEDYNYSDYDTWSRTDCDTYRESYKKCAYNVHIPSTSRPLRLGKYYGGYSIQSPGSEIGVMDVYKDYVDIRGIICADEDSYIDYSDFNYELTEYIDFSDSRMFDNIIASDDNTFERFHDDELGEDGVVFTFTDVNQYFSLPKKTGSLLELRNIYLIDKDGNSLIDSLDYYNPNIGFYDKPYKRYKLFADTLSSRDSESGFELGVSENFEFTESFPIKLYITGSVFHEKITNVITYKNSYSPLAHYRLNVGGENNNNIESKDYSYFYNKINEHK